MKRINLLVVVAVLLAVAAIPVSADAGRQANDLLAFADLTDVGTAELERTGDDVRARVHASAPAGVYTMWWVVWNTPEGCATPYACGEVDLFDPEGDTGLAIGFGGGTVVGGNGVLTHSASLAEGTTLRGFPYTEFGAVGVSLTETSLLDSDRAEIHLVFRSHQSVIPEMLRSQLTTFNGGCSYDPPLDVSNPDYGVPGPNTCADTYFAIFAASARP